MQLLDLTEGRPAQVHDVPRVPFQLEGWMDTLLVENSEETHTGLVQWAAPYLPTYGHAVEVFPFQKLARRTFRSHRSHTTLPLVS